MIFLGKIEIMRAIKKQIVTDEAFQPVAVIISYQDWQRIEALLQRQDRELLNQLESTEAVVWSPQVEEPAVQALSDLLAAARGATNA